MLASNRAEHSNGDDQNVKVYVDAEKIPQRRWGSTFGRERPVNVDISVVGDHDVEGMSAKQRW